MKLSFEEHAKLTVQSAHQLTELRNVLDCLERQLAMKGKFDDEDIKSIKRVSDILRLIRLLNVLLGHLGGLSNKRLANIHGLSASRISQIIKTARLGETKFL